MLGVFKPRKHVLNLIKCGQHRYVITSVDQAKTAGFLPEGQTSWSHTLLLPKTTFPLRSTPENSEAPYHAKTTEGLYKWQNEWQEGPLFVLHDGPPYANGSLHMGHALNKIIKDIINRYHVIRGRRVNYIPGWDCHGLPIENKTLQELKKDSRQLAPHDIRIEARRVAEREINRQKEEFQKFGIMADWSEESTYRTLDRAYEIRQLKIFQKMVEKGFIYRDYRPVYFSPSSRTALAEGELVYRDDHVSHTVYVTFKLDRLTSTVDAISTKLRELLASEVDVRVMVWTTTPWTLTANMGIAVHSELMYSAVRRHSDNAVIIIASERLLALKEILGPYDQITDFSGNDLVGAVYLPLYPQANFHKSAAILSAPFVTSETGTGLVHCAPAHGLEDYNAFQSLKLLSAENKMICHVNSLGQFDASVSRVVGEEYARELVGKEVLKEGSRAIVKQLVEMSVIVGGVQRLKHRYPYDWKTDEPVIITATSQWFANLEKIKESALKLLSDVTFFPENLRTRLTTFLDTRSEWCISRQRAWGVPIPALHFTPSSSLPSESSEPSTRAFLESKTLSHIIPILQEKGTDHWFSDEVDEFVPPELRLSQGDGTWSKSLDTMDVWFDSGTSWAHLLTRGIFSGTLDRKRYGQAPYPPPEVDEFSVDAPALPAKLQKLCDNDMITVADVCVEGSDQHRGWFQSLLLTAVAYSTRNDVSSASSSSPIAQEVKIIRPFKTVLTHGMVLDEHNKKMSKSVGNVISPLSVINGTLPLPPTHTKSDPSIQGISPLRFWTASVEYWKDAPFGAQHLLQSTQALQKIRNSARFILSVLESSKRVNDPVETGRIVTWEHLSVVDRYILHELYNLDKTCKTAYEQYNFPRVITSISHFANITLSSLYFDINKDVLYADHINSIRRQAIVWTLGKVLTIMTQILAPIVPHLAEEINSARYAGDHSGDDERSVFERTWTNLPRQWLDKEAFSDMTELLRLRSIVLKLLEDARRDGKIRSSLECELHIWTNPIAAPEDKHTIKILERYELHLPTLFIISTVTLTRNIAKIVLPNPEWRYYVPIQPSGSGPEAVIPKLSTEFIKNYDKDKDKDKTNGIRQANIRAVLVPPSKDKCSRCWTYNAKVKGRVCDRCLEVVHHNASEHFQTFKSRFPHVPVIRGNWINKKNMFT